MRVLRGITLPEGNSPYQVWRNVLRHLALGKDISALEGSVLKAAIPDIEALLERPVPDAPVLSSQDSQSRMAVILQALLKRQAQPVLIILEDMHWISRRQPSSGAMDHPAPGRVARDDRR